MLQLSARSRCLPLVSGFSAVALALACGSSDSPPDAPPALGSLQVTVVTNGLEIDDAYSVLVEGESPKAIAADGTLTFPGVAAGSYSVSLSDIADNCALEGPNPRTVTVAVQEMATVTFTVACVRPNAFVVQRQTDKGDELYTIASDGSRPIQLTNNNVSDYQPVFSPDGSKIAFLRLEFHANVWVMNRDGSNPHRVTDDLVDYFDPAWSPDGTKIVVGRRTATGIAINLLNPDNGALTPLTPGTSIDEHPAFSPDGSRIAFTTNRHGDYELYTMTSSGTDLLRITTNGADESQPEYSVDGSKIMFVSTRSGNDDIFLMSASGGEATQLTFHSAHDFCPRFSPDGTKIVFTSERIIPAEIFTMNADGSTAARLTSNTTNDWCADWRP